MGWSGTSPNQTSEQPSEAGWIDFRSVSDLMETLSRNKLFKAFKLMAGFESY
jgi:hypothetical protein